MKKPLFIDVDVAKESNTECGCSLEMISGKPSPLVTRLKGHKDSFIGTHYDLKTWRRGLWAGTAATRGTGLLTGHK